MHIFLLVKICGTWNKKTILVSHSSIFSLSVLPVRFHIGFHMNFLCLVLYFGWSPLNVGLVSYCSFLNDLVCSFCINLFSWGLSILLESVLWLPFRKLRPIIPLPHCSIYILIVFSSTSFRQVSLLQWKPFYNSWGITSYPCYYTYSPFPYSTSE